jgi:hypothetical protein
MTDKFDEAPRDGKCKGYDTNLWFPIFGQSPTKEERKINAKNTAQALLVCNQCDKSYHCLEYSLRHEPYGIWGGETELRRAQMRANRNIRLSRDARLFFPGIGTRNANGNFTINENGSFSLKKESESL